VAELRTADDEDAPAAEPRRLADDPSIAALLAARNERLAAFWLNPQDGSDHHGPFAGRSAIGVDSEDRFTTMLAHQLRHPGFEVAITSWTDADPAAIDVADIVVSGPGPGDPRDPDSPRLARMRDVVAARLASRRPLLAV